MDSDFTGNHDAFEKIFKMYFKDLHAYACLFLKDDTASSEAVQQVFYKIWERKENISVHTSLQAYLYKSVYNECMLQLKKQKNMHVFKSHISYYEKNKTAEGASGKADEKELQLMLQHAINKLPDQCRIIFQLNRFEGLKYREIATEMNLSVKTIENQMGKALKRLRAALADFLPLLIFLLCKF